MNRHSLNHDIVYDEIKRNAILTTIEYDCEIIYVNYAQNLVFLEKVLECYEEFITNEINKAEFVEMNYANDDDANHLEKFRDFLDKADSESANHCAPMPKKRKTDGIYIVSASVQDWLLRGQKGPQFHTTVDICVFKYHTEMKPYIFHKHLSKNARPMNKLGMLEPMAELSKFGKPISTFLAFQNQCLLQCPVHPSMKENIVRLHEQIKSAESIASCRYPLKCAHLFLSKLFFNVRSYSNVYNQVVFTVNDNHSFQGDGWSGTRAANSAAWKALTKLCRIESEEDDVVDIKPNVMIRNCSPSANTISILVTELCAKTDCFSEIQRNYRNVVAGIVQTINGDINSGAVIVLASGTKCIDAENMNYTTVNDSHAEIVARRGLIRYFCDQLKLLYDERNANDVSDSIFERNATDSKWPYKLKNGIGFHLFTTRAPCGDATASINCKIVSDLGKLRAKVERKEGYTLLEHIVSAEQLAGSFHEGAPLYTATCSDKMARWNVVGIQGTLLSQIIPPIYFNSIVMSQYKHYRKNECVRALYGRIENSVQSLPPSYRHHKPKIEFAACAYKRDTSIDPSPFSYNWIAGQPNVERIQSNIGLALNNASTGPSRISKIERLKQFVDLMEHLPHANEAGTFDAKQSYGEMKAKAIDYNRAKDACIRAFEMKSLGCWSKVQKPSDIERFSLSSNSPRSTTDNLIVII